MKKADKPVITNTRDLREFINYIWNTAVDDAMASVFLLQGISPFDEEKQEKEVTMLVRWSDDEEVQKDIENLMEQFIRKEFKNDIHK